jgi:hypothetical protein
LLIKSLCRLPLAPFTRSYFVFLLYAPVGRYKNPPLLHWAQPLVPKATAQKRFFQTLELGKTILKLSLGG